MLAERAADFLAERITQTLRRRRNAKLALSGGSTPLPTFRALARHRLEWPRVHLFQVDERVAPPGSPDRNLTSLKDTLGETGAVLHPIPVDLPVCEAVKRYAESIHDVVGDPPRFDVVQLGLGSDGHTASLFPSDPALSAQGDVVETSTHAGWARISLTLRTINNAEVIQWLVSGSEKRAAVMNLRCGNTSVPAGRVRRENTVLFGDHLSLEPSH